jgi:hypothetical protein
MDRFYIVKLRVSLRHAEIKCAPVSVPSVRQTGATECRVPKCSRHIDPSKLGHANLLGLC